MPRIVITPAMIATGEWAFPIGILLQRRLSVQALVFERFNLSGKILDDDRNAGNGSRQERIVLV